MIKAEFTCDGNHIIISKLILNLFTILNHFSFQQFKLAQKFSIPLKQLSVKQFYYVIQFLFILLLI